MRLLTYDSNNKLSLTRNLSDQIPPYAILSHTWGTEDEEVTYDDLQDEQYEAKAGYRKLQFCQQQAKKDGLQHFWIDTCCIDRTNHVELSEAITSMYRWYRDAQVCYVYLADVSSEEGMRNGDDGEHQPKRSWKPNFRRSRWFTRGWTLQELLAPDEVVFYSKEGELLGTKSTLKELLSEITSIPMAALDGRSPSRFSVPERLRWAKGRSTKRKEDEAYCLLGIFGISMPPLYGEGDRAWHRLHTTIREQIGSDSAKDVSTTRNSEEVLSLGLCLTSAPLIRPEHFIGRGGYIDVMHKALCPEESSHEQRRVVLGGKGGIGKTQLSIAYAREYEYTYTSILWLNATSDQTLRASVRSIACAIVAADELATLNDEQILTKFHGWLSQPRNNRWLLIFDNYDEPDQYDIGHFYPNIGHGSIIITTRLPSEVTGLEVKVQPLQALDDSLEILQTRSGRDGVRNDPSARSLAERLEGLPLALVSAGSYLRRSTVSFQQYLNVYNQRWQIDPRRPQRIQDYPNRTLYTTWDLSYARLVKEDSEAAQMLKLLAYFDNQDMWYELFQAGLGAHSPAWLQAPLSDQVNFENLMGILVDYCFIEVQHTTQSYSMHNCVHDWTLGSLNEEVSPQLYWYAFACVYGSITEGDPYTFAHIKYTRASRHGARLANHRFSACHQLESDETKLKHTDLHMDWRVVMMLVEQDQLLAAEQLNSRTLAEAERLLGSNDLLTLKNLHVRGYIYQSQGKLSEAEEMFVKALDGFEQLPAANSDLSANLACIHNLGSVYYDQGKYSEAEGMFSRALAGAEKELGIDHHQMLNTITYLGYLYQSQDKLDEAEQMFVRALATAEKEFGPDHSSMFNTLHRLGYLYHDMGKLDEAEQMFLRSLAGDEKYYGPEHRATLHTVYGLGIVYHDQGKLDKAEELYDRVLAVHEQVVDPDHRLSRQTVPKLEELYRAQSRTAEAEQLRERFPNIFAKAIEK